MTSTADLISAAQPQEAADTHTSASLLEGAGFSPQDIASSSQAADAAPTAPSSVASRVKTGLGDLGVGVAQLAGHVFGQENVSPQERAAYGVSPDADLSFDKVVADREKDYQAGRAAAGSKGFDWARTAGEAANPGNYVLPGGAARSVAGRVIGAAAQGGAVSALNPVNEPGNFWGGKIWQTGTGMLTGLLGAGSIELLSKPFTAAANGIRNALGKSSKGAADAAAQGTIDQVLGEAGIKPTDLPPEMVEGAREQIAHAVKTDGVVDPVSLRSQAEAASLPIPIKLLRGQASGDAEQYAAEQEAAKIAGKGPNPALQQMTENNQKLMDNLGAMGAKDAPSAAEAGTAGLTTLAKMDQKLDQAKNAAYSAVRDSQGRSAKLNPEAFYMNAESGLERDNAGSFLPENIRSIYEDVTEGRLPFTVDTMTSLDKILSRAQRTTQDGNASHAIGIVRSALADTPVDGEMGQQAIAAYAKAKGLAKAQFALSDPKEQTFIPAYAAMLKGMGNASQDEFVSALQGGTANVDPGKWFSSSVMNDTPAAVRKLMGFLKNADPSTTQTLQHGTMGAIRDAVVKGNDDVGRATFSNLAMGKVMDRAATLHEVLPADTVSALGRLYNTSSRISGVPYKAAVNWSNTAAASVNLQTAKEAAGVLGATAAHAIPGGSQVLAGAGVVGNLAKARAARQAAQDATKAQYAVPGKSASSLKRAAYGAAVPLSSLLSGRDRSTDQ